MDSSQHVSFYLFVLQQLMWPSSLQSAFTESPGCVRACLSGNPIEQQGWVCACIDTFSYEILMRCENSCLLWAQTS